MEKTAHGGNVHDETLTRPVRLHLTGGYGFEGKPARNDIVEGDHARTSELERLLQAEAAQVEHAGMDDASPAPIAVPAGIRALAVRTDGERIALVSERKSSARCILTGQRQQTRRTGDVEHIRRPLIRTRLEGLGSHRLEIRCTFVNIRRKRDHALGAILNAKQAREIKFTVEHVAVIDMHQRYAIHLIAASTQKIVLKRHVMIIDIVNARGRLHFHQVQTIRLDTQNVDHAHIALVAKSRLADDASPIRKERARTSGHPLEITRIKRNLDERPEITHGKIAHVIARLENRLVQNGIVELLGHMRIHPKHFGTLNPARVPGFRQVHERASPSIRQRRDNERTVIAGIAPRRNVFVRPPMANLDVLFLVASTTQPTPSTLVLDKLSAIAVDKGVQPVIVCTKSDLAEAEFLRSAYEKSTLPFIRIDYATGEGLDDIKHWINGRLCAFCGNSGVGKSTLLNALLPDVERQTAAISQKLGRGRHTTREVTIFEAFGGRIADTPGFASLEASRAGFIPKEGLEHAFPEFGPYLGACQFTGCSHRSEKGCAVRAALAEGKLSQTRYDSYCAMYDEVKDVKEWQYPLSR